MYDINNVTRDFDPAALWRRLQKNAFKFGPRSCWVWIGARNDDGYGRVQMPAAGRFKPFKLAAHRLAWVLNRGPIPNELYVLHRCDNRGCINPGHLFLGTQADNMLDMARKGRGHGYHEPASTSVRRAIRADPRPNLQVAKAYGLSRTAVILIRRG